MPDDPAEGNEGSKVILARILLVLELVVGLVLEGFDLTKSWSAFAKLDFWLVGKSWEEARFRGRGRSVAALPLCYLLLKIRLRFSGKSRST